MAESFFGSLKTELVDRHTCSSRHDAELAIFALIEGWYNPERIIAGLASMARWDADTGVKTWAGLPVDADAFLVFEAAD